MSYVSVFYMAIVVRLVGNLMYAMTHSYDAVTRNGTELGIGPGPGVGFGPGLATGWSAAAVFGAESEAPHARSKELYMAGSRLIVGFGAGSMAVCNAYVAGATTPEERSGAMGAVAASGAVGFIFGPALALMFSGIKGDAGSTAVLLNFQTLPAYMAALLCVINIVLLRWKFEEFRINETGGTPHTPADGRRGGVAQGSSINSSAGDDEESRGLLGRSPADGSHGGPGRGSTRPDMCAVLTILVTFFLSMITMSMFEAIQVVLVQAEFNWDDQTADKDTSIINACFGIQVVFVFVAAKNVAKRIGERQTLMFGLLVTGLGQLVGTPWTGKPVVAGDDNATLVGAFGPLQAIDLAAGRTRHDRAPGWREWAHPADHGPSPGVTAVGPAPDVDPCQKLVPLASCKRCTNSFDNFNNSCIWCDDRPKESQCFSAAWTDKENEPKNFMKTCSKAKCHESPDYFVQTGEHRCSQLSNTSTCAASPPPPEAFCEVHTHCHECISHRLLPKKVCVWCPVTSKCLQGSQNELSQGGCGSNCIKGHTDTSSNCTVVANASDFCPTPTPMPTSAPTAAPTAPQLCPYEWCEKIPRLQLWQYLLSAIIVNSAAPMANVMLFTLYSRVLGPVQQGLWMGLLNSAGSLARMTGPIAIVYLFRRYGLQIMMGAAAAVSVVGFLLCLVAFSHLVPHVLQREAEGGGSGGDGNGGSVGAGERVAVLSREAAAAAEPVYEGGDDDDDDIARA